MMPAWLDQIQWNIDGLLPVVTQETTSLKVLMHAWMNLEALQKTVQEGKAVYWSRKRQAIWTKGEVSGHFQWVDDIYLDCDCDTLLLMVKQTGGIACHTGRHSCFLMKLEQETWQTTEPILKNPEQIYNDPKP